ncbi:cytochrome c prime [Beijerinckia indica subsp. indica ATCC 9039]|uniref:Cytochrome c prime n=2 Tax=Beijerinckia TaxID=532 RepID=B2IBP8_BEII9|nr:cytochrome c prime [Beijerinckia indica subsp. indica ATCC 9039]
MRKKLLLGTLFLMSATSLLAANDPIAQRKDILKEIGEVTKPVVGMLKGEVPFDRAKVDAALTAYADGIPKLPSLFPDDSKTGGKTEAKARIWDEKPKFEALFKKFGEDVKTTQGTITDVASLKANFPKVLGDCKSCHDDYREKH